MERQNLCAKCTNKQTGKKNLEFPFITNCIFSQTTLKTVSLPTGVYRVKMKRPHAKQDIYRHFKTSCTVIYSEQVYKRLIKVAVG